MKYLPLMFFAVTILGPTGMIFGVVPFIIDLSRDVWLNQRLFKT